MFTAEPATLVPAPRGSTGAPYVRQTASAASTSSESSGSTTAIGTCR